MFKVKNISTDPRRLKVNGRNIIIMPGEEIQTSYPPSKSNVFEVKEVKTKEVNE